MEGDPDDLEDELYWDEAETDLFEDETDLYEDETDFSAAELEAAEIDVAD